LENAVELGSKLIESIFAEDPAEVTKALVDGGAPLWYQDEDGFSALHASCFQENSSLIQMLIDKGAIWNAVDSNGNSAADVALSLNNAECYRIIRDAGIRSEFLLHLLKSRGESPENMTLRSTDTSAVGSTDTFLETQLRYVTDESGQEIVLAKTDDGSDVGVMMGWEHDISCAEYGRYTHATVHRKGLWS